MVQTSLVCILMVFFCNFGTGYCAVYHAMLPEKPEEFRNVPGCYVKEIGNVIAVGEAATPSAGFCYKIECSRFYLHYYTCGVVGTDDPKCYITDEDLSVPYPNCCPTVKCDTNYLS